MSTTTRIRYLIFVIFASILPFVLNLLGVDFASQSVALDSSGRTLSELSKDDQFYALSGALHHIILEWSAVTLALISGVVSFVHYYRYRDVSVPIIGMALLCAGFTDAFHTLAATRIISASVPNADFIPFTWAFSRIFNVTLMIIGVSISLWITRKSVFFQDKFPESSKSRYEARILVITAIGFISLAIIMVMFAATSDVLPKTTFPKALITRPYDVLPLALFIFSGSLVWGWYQRKHSLLKFALLLSIIPEIATQLHMSFGSTNLFDNHFNIAHALKIVAYGVLTTGIISSLLQTNDDETINRTEKLLSGELKTRRASDSFTRVDNDQLLEIGTAKYPQVLLISSFTFIIAIAVSILVSTIFYVDSTSLAREKKYEEVEVHSGFIEPLIKEIYIRSEDDLHFLSKTPPIQGIIQSIKNNDEMNLALWTDRLNTIFKEKIRSDHDYQQLRYTQYSSAKKELNKSYKINQSVYTAKGSQLKIVPDISSNLKDISRKGEVVFKLSALSSKQVEKHVSTLTLSISIFDFETGDFFGVLDLDLDLSSFISRLQIDSLSKNEIFLADKKGGLIFRSGDYSNLEYQQQLQVLFPELKKIIEINKSNIRLEKSSRNSLDNSDSSEDELLGFYKILHLQDSDKSNIMRLFIRIDSNEISNEFTVLRERSLMLGLALSVLSLAFAILISRKISAPLQQATQELVRFGYTGEVGNLPVDAKDETGVLARSFHNMLINKAVQDRELMQQKDALDVHAIVSITDVAGNIDYVNQKFIDISGYSFDELIGQNHRILNSNTHSFEFFKELYQSISTGNVWQGEICNKAKSGDFYWVNTTIVPFMDSKGKPKRYVSIRTDITTVKNSEKQLQSAKSELTEKVSKLEEVNAELDQFAYVASHDLKSPLNGISQLVTWIEEDCEDILPLDSKEHLGLLRSRSKRIITLLNDLLEYSRVGRQEHHVSTFYLSELVEDIFDLQGGTEGFSCVAPRAEMTLQKTPFDLVVRNLISNAIKHHDKKTGKLEISFEEDSQDYIIRVQDDGPGIPPKLHNKALEMFQTLQSRDTTEGSGMGLALVKKTVIHHGGALTIDSDGGRGTGIIVKWPKQNK